MRRLALGAGRCCANKFARSRSCLPLFKWGTRGSSFRRRFCLAVKRHACCLRSWRFPLFITSYKVAPCSCKCSQRCWVIFPAAVRRLCVTFQQHIAYYCAASFAPPNIFFCFILEGLGRGSRKDRSWSRLSGFSRFPSLHGAGAAHCKRERKKKPRMH